MYSNKQTNKHPAIKSNITLTKFKSSYDKLEKEMNKPPSDYDGIKELIELQNNHITNVQNNINKKSKINVQMTNHNKNNRMKK